MFQFWPCFTMPSGLVGAYDREARKFYPSNLLEVEALCRAMNDNPGLANGREVAESSTHLVVRVHPHALAKL